ncbi:cellulose binding domain-containing protein [Vibrio sp. S4M6]|uniref:cellulose binding domain-containing protein n=1 Tax=Vibrio sinus TaxID=2946865 RepID=UPI00202A0328|nr:cellulose binding domain-containing protein [Vibrio sinus]MCL9782112.1 cellulose binding domain-containing protein [Vibrio sinus]
MTIIRKRSMLNPIIVGASLLITSATLPVMAQTLEAPKNVIGFFQSYDSSNTWTFNGTGENLADSGYTTLVDAFWVNYPYCWGDGSGTPGAGSPIPSCLGIVNAPGPGESNTIDSDFWDSYSGESAPDTAGEEYNNYWTSLHTTGPGTISKLREKIDKIGNNTISGQKIKLLAGIGGWNMGGSAAGQPHTPTPPEDPAWAALLKDPSAFATAMSDIVNLTVNGNKLYDGIDLDIETLYGLGCEEDTCTESDKDRAVTSLVSAITDFKTLEPNAILSVSPRAADIACEQKYCSWSNAEGLGFMGEVLQQLAEKGVYVDEINPQFYNDDGARNIPNANQSGELSYGDQVVGILQKLKETGALGPNTSLNIGVLAQTNDHQTDTGGASDEGNPGVDKESVSKLWALLKQDPAIKGSGVSINGIMTWAVNLALNNTGIGGNVRTLSSPSGDVVPYNWPSELFTAQDDSASSTDTDNSCSESGSNSSTDTNDSSSTENTSSCTLSISANSSWQTGAVFNGTVTNNGSEPMKKFTLKISLDANTISSPALAGSWVGVNNQDNITGSTITISADTYDSYNGLMPGESQNVGFQLSGNVIGTPTVLSASCQ